MSVLILISDKLSVWSVRLFLPSPPLGFSLRIWANVTSPLSGVWASLWGRFFRILLKKPPDLRGTETQSGMWFQPYSETHSVSSHGAFFHVLSDTIKRWLPVRCGRDGGAWILLTGTILVFLSEGAASGAVTVRGWTYLQRRTQKLKMMNRDYTGNCSSLVVRLYNKHLSGWWRAGSFKAWRQTVDWWGGHINPADRKKPHLL